MKYILSALLFSCVVVVGYAIIEDVYIVALCLPSIAYGVCFLCNYDSKKDCIVLDNLLSCNERAAILMRCEVRNGKKCMSKACDCYQQNRDENLCFVILCYFDDSVGYRRPSEESFISELKEYSYELNQKYGYRFYFFVERRIYAGEMRPRRLLLSFGESLYNLVSYIFSNDSMFSDVYADRCFLSKVKYIFTLPYNTKLPVNIIARSISAIKNRKSSMKKHLCKKTDTNGMIIIDNKHYDGYGLINVEQYRMRVEKEIAYDLTAVGTVLCGKTMWWDKKPWRYLSVQGLINNLISLKHIMFIGDACLIVECLKEILVYMIPLISVIAVILSIVYEPYRIPFVIMFAYGYRLLPELTRLTHK